jgi:rRNA-processing protein FCF1
MKRIILDTNFLIDLGRFGISIDEIGKILPESYEMEIVGPSIEELKKIAATNVEESKFAKYALMIIDLRKIRVLTADEFADNAILSLVDKDALVATNDVELRKKLKIRGIRCIYVRAKKKLEIG